MKLSFMVGEWIVFYVQFFSGHVLCPKFGHIQEHHWILQCVQSGKMATWNTSQPTTSSNTYAQHVAQLEALALASTSEIGTHSLRLGAAMEMYLGEISVYIIMLISKWLSDAFLCYIQKQVEQFLRKVAKKMLTFWSF